MYKSGANAGADAGASAHSSVDAADKLIWIMGFPCRSILSAQATLFASNCSAVHKEAQPDSTRVVHRISTNCPSLSSRAVACMYRDVGSAHEPKTLEMVVWQHCVKDLKADISRDGNLLDQVQNEYWHECTQTKKLGSSRQAPKKKHACATLHSESQERSGNS